MSLVDIVVNELHAEIKSGRWKVGDRIPPESELVNLLGVSRVSVRAGVQSLVHAGLLVTRQGDGTFVVATDVTDVALRRRLEKARQEHVLQVRYALDVAAARLAALNRTERDLRGMTADLEARVAAFATRDVEAFVAADVAFHLKVAVATHNPVLSDLYGSLVGALAEAMRRGSCLETEEAADGEVLHEELFRAIRDREVDKAVDTAFGLVDASIWEVETASEPVRQKQDS
ncbi:MULTISPECIES: FadR/GntR family transcriptional regulator [unclassified Streptomyces]|uniref:FadR/GntR family transcriptional regulator n=1 Tax=unclassified Streptomyces TaxID=2593676 RepID=UPI003686DBFE